MDEKLGEEKYFENEKDKHIWEIHNFQSSRFPSNLETLCITWFCGQRIRKNPRTGSNLLAAEVVQPEKNFKVHSPFYNRLCSNQDLYFAYGISYFSSINSINNYIIIHITQPLVKYF